MPLILTLQLDSETAEFFSRVRRQYFPLTLNVVPAHVTLFHRLPDAEREDIALDIQRAAGTQGLIVVTVSGLRNLGRGVAYTLESPELHALRNRLSGRWWDWLSPQDRQAFKPHITVQNKVAPAVARETLAAIRVTFLPHTAKAIGLCLWEYRSGPWEHVRTFRFME